MPLNVWTLVVAQALAMCTAPFIVFIGSLQGRLLATSADLATLPVGLVVLGTVAGIKPATWMMARVGRKPVMLAGCLVGCAAALVGASASWLASFPLLCGAAFIGGMGLAVVHQYRFAAMESVPAGLAGSAAARVLLGGMVAAWLGPELALIGHEDGDARPFLGGWLVLASVQLLAGLVLWLGYRGYGVQADSQASGDGRPMGQILRQPVIWAAVSAAAIGYALMSFIMTATPLSMTEMAGHPVADAKLVIQVHILAMYLPSLVSGWLTRALGLKWMMIGGLASYLACVWIATSGTGFAHYLAALALLGLGWNLLFVSGTTLLPQGYEASERFRVQGLNDLLIFGVQAVAALSAGAVLAAVGWRWLVLLAIPFVLVHATVMVLWMMERRKAVPEQT